MGGGGGGGGGGRRRRNYEAQGVRQVMDAFKNEVALELGIANYDQIDKGDLPARFHGKVGGNMVRKMIQMAESQLLAGGAPAIVNTTWNTGTVGFNEGRTGGPDSIAMAEQAGLYMSPTPQQSQ